MNEGDLVRFDIDEVVVTFSVILLVECVILLDIITKRFVKLKVRSYRIGVIEKDGMGRW